MIMYFVKLECDRCKKSIEQEFDGEKVDAKSNLFWNATKFGWMVDENDPFGAVFCDKCKPATTKKERG